MTNSFVDLWPLIQEIYRTVFAARRKVFQSPPPFKEISEAFGLTDSTQQIGGFLYLLENYHPEMISTGHYRERNVYDNPVVIDKMINALLTDRLIEPTVYGHSVTDKGYQLYAHATEKMRPRWELPLGMESQLERILELMRRLVDVTFAVPEPPPHWGTTTRAKHGIKLTPAALPLERLIWHTFDLWAYRDDAHLASWVHYGVSPFAWEALSYLWEGKANSVEKLLEKNSFREFTAEEWSNYLKELETCGWITFATDGTYSLTESGKAVRDESERLTNEYFYTPWVCLNEAETVELRTLLTQLRDKLAAIAA